MFRAALETSPIYNLIGRKDRLADILWELELATVNKFQVDSGRPAGLTIEHILPQTWRNNLATYRMERQAKISSG